MLRLSALPAVLALLPLGAAPAAAGAFLLEEGQTQIIATARFSGAAAEFDAYGRVKPLPDYRKFELTALAEYGLTRDLTLILQSAVEDVRSRSGDGAHEAGLGVSALGGRMRLLNFGGSVLSVQAVALLPGSVGGTGLDETRRAGADVRLLAGKPFAVFGRSGFVSFEAGYRVRLGGLEEWRAEATMGLRPSPSWLLLSQAYFTAAPRDEFGRRNVLRLKSDISVVYRLSPRWSAQAGYGATVYGHAAAREAGPFMAAWSRF
jgi:hypothetical protein